jgi:hypothetical protein
MAEIGGDEWACFISVEPHPAGLLWISVPGATRPLHPPPLQLNSDPHHSLSEQDVPSRSAFNAWIGLVS